MLPVLCVRDTSYEKAQDIPSALSDWKICGSDDSTAEEAFADARNDERRLDILFQFGIDVVLFRLRWFTDDAEAVGETEGDGTGGGNDSIEIAPAGGATDAADVPEAA